MPDESASQAPEDAAARLDRLRQRLRQLPPDELRDGLKQLEAATKTELEERLRPFRTPVTDSTMRRSARS